MKRIVLFIDHDLSRSGSTVSLGYLVKKFLEERFDVFILTPKVSEESEYLSELGAKIVPFNSTYIKSFAIDLHFTTRLSVFTIKGFILLIKDVIKFLYGLAVTFSAVKKLRPDLLYINEYVVFQSSIIGYLMKIPTVIHLRSRFLSGTLGIRRYFLSKSILKFNDLVIAISNQEKQQLKLNKEEEEKVKVIGEFLDSRNFQTDIPVSLLKRKYDFPDDKKIILMLGGIYSIKGSLDFLKAAEIVIEAGNEPLFVIAGKILNNTIDERAYYQQCMSVINLLQVKHNVRLMGMVSKPEELIACSDIFVSTITDSHFSRPIIEAWSQRKPIISYSNVHALELVENNVDGLLIEIGNYARLAQGIIKLLMDEETSARIGQNGYQKVQKEFNPEINLQRVYEYCCSLLNKKHQLEYYGS